MIEKYNKGKKQYMICGSKQRQKLEKKFVKFKSNDVQNP